ncbi:thioesterase II family protein [Kitasatospora sp. NPDC004240]
MTLGQPPGAGGVRLFCIPYAGGNPELFRAWGDLLDPGVELLAVRLPGRGRRLAERPYDDWKTLVADAFAALAPYLDRPHAFYGHSFGGRLGYELARLAAEERPGLTRRLFVSGCRSPRWPQLRPFMHELPREGFLEELRRMGGTPPEILDHPGLMRLLLPVIHGEIRLAELWEDVHGTPAEVPITAMYGERDRIDGEAATLGWAEVGGPGSEVLRLPGGHFFLETHRQDLLDVLNSRLGQWR